MALCDRFRVTERGPAYRWGQHCSSQWRLKGTIANEVGLKKGVSALFIVDHHFTYGQRETHGLVMSRFEVVA